VLRNAALHDAVLAAPDDDAPRLVYADWLLERGDPRGELIATQIALAGNPDDAALRARERELMTAHRETWIAASRSMQPQFRNGFIERISVGGGELVGLAAAVEDACIRELEVRTLQRDLAVVSAQFSRMALRRFHLHYRIVFPETLVPLLAAPEIARLETLALQVIEYDPGALEALIDADLPALRDLWLSHGRIDAAAIGKLAKWRRPLRSFDVSHNKIGRGSIAKLLEAPGFRALESLDLRATSLETSDVIELCAVNPPLVGLNLASCSVGTSGAMAIAAWPGARRLRSLGLADAGIGADGLAALAASKQLPQGMTLALDADLLGLEARGSRWVGQIDPALTARFDIVIDGEPAY
jgi:uncharacterized protein (TIGR02996 family)